MLGKLIRNATKCNESIMFSIYLLEEQASAIINLLISADTFLMLASYTHFSLFRKQKIFFSFCRFCNILSMNIAFYLFYDF